MRRAVFALMFTSVIAVNLPAADQQLVNLVMPEAKAVAGINVASLRNSPFGAFLLRQTAEINPDLQKFVDLTGFNPQTDLDEVLVASLGALQTGAAADAPAVVAGGNLAATPGMRGLILARGKFNMDKIAALAKSDGKQKLELYNGVTLISDPKDKVATAMAFFSPTIAVAGDLVSVKAAIDQRDRANSLDPQLVTKMNSLSASQDAWAVSMIPLSSINAGPATDPTLQGALGGDLFKKITSTSGGIKFGTEVELSTEMVTTDEKNASSLGDVLKFLVGMVSMNAGPAKGAPSAIVTLLQTLSIQAEGNVVNLKLSIPEGQIEAWFNSMQVGKPGVKI